MYTLISKNPEIILKSQANLLRLVPIDDNIVHISFTARGEFLPECSDDDYTPIVTHRPPCRDFTVTEDDERVSLCMNECTVKVSKSTGAISYFDKFGRLYTKEPDRGGRILREVDVYRNEFSADGNISHRSTANGVKVVAGSSASVFDRKAYQAKVKFEFSDEALYGFGSHEEGVGNLRGHHRDLYQHNMKACVPSFVSTKGYGFLFDCRSFMTFDDTEVGSYVWCDTVDELDYYFIAGRDVRDIHRGYRLLTGSSPLLPKWAYGYGQSKERYKCADELIAIVEEYRRRGIPLWFIIQDWLTWEDGKWGQKTFDSSRFPDPDKLTAKLHELGARMMISIWPNMNGMGDNQKELIDAGCMLGNRSTYNAFMKKARNIYWRQAYDGLFSHGVDAWWCDCSEPFEADWSGDVKPEPHERIAINVGEGKKYLDDAEISAYSLNHSRGIYEGQRGTSNKRVVNLTRSSYAGQHRYATITWSGDIASSWDVLARQIPEGLNFCASGEPYWSFDIGGFFVAPGGGWFRAGGYKDGVDDLGYRELYVRWLELGAFLPMMRSHGTDTPREIWRFGEAGEPFYDAIAKYIRLRSELMPYIYSTAADVCFDGGAFMTPLGLAFPNDTTCYDIRDEFMFGGSLLVCPVTKPMYYESDSRPIDAEKKWRVYLPAGCGWYDFETGEYYQGGREVEVDAPLDKLPLFAREGSIIPLAPALEYPEQQENPELTLRIYPGRDAEYRLYDDAGDCYGYENGEYSLTTIRWNEANRKLSCVREGSYPGMPDERSARIWLPDAKLMKSVTFGVRQS